MPALLPPAPPPVSYLERERSSALGCVRRIVWLAAVTAVLGVAAAVCIVGAAIAFGPDDWGLGVIAWLLLSIVGATWFVRSRERRRVPAAAPWERDRKWPRGGEARGGIERGLSPWRWASLWIIIPILHAAGGLLVLGWGGVVSPGLFAAFAVSVVLVVFVVLLTRAWLQGGVELRWDDFPMRTGTRVRFHVATTTGGSSMPEFTATLRCVETRSGAFDIERPTEIVCSVPRATNGPLAAGPEEFVTVEFDIPADAPGTDLDRPGDERYWELVVLGTTAWGKIAESFVVPVYAVAAATSPLPAQLA